MIPIFSQSGLCARLMRLIVVGVAIYSACIFSIASAEISAVLSPLASAVWVPGKQETITYRISGEPDGESYEIDLMSGNPNNAQLVHVFEQTAVPTVAGVNSVTVDVPSTIPEGTYGVRLGLPDDNDWKYSQLFTISHDGNAAADTAGNQKQTGDFAPVPADAKGSEGNKDQIEPVSGQSESSTQTSSGNGVPSAFGHLAVVILLYSLL